MTTRPTTPPRGSLSEAQIRQITRALENIGECPCPRRRLAGRAARLARRRHFVPDTTWRGEVRLIKEKGRLRFIQTVTSEAACDAAHGAGRETPATGHPHA